MRQLAERVRRLRAKAGGRRCPACGTDLPPPDRPPISVIEIITPPRAWEELLRYATDEDLTAIENVLDAMERRAADAERAHQPGGEL